MIRLHTFLVIFFYELESCIKTSLKINEIFEQLFVDLKNTIGDHNIKLKDMNIINFDNPFNFIALAFYQTKKS